MRYIYIVALFLFIGSAHACQLGNINIDTNFSNATNNSLLSRCETDEQKTIMLGFSPENTPINHSPWYAFKVSSIEPVKVNMVLTVENSQKAHHRYPPKVSVDGKTWTALPHKFINGSIHFDLMVNEKPIFVSAQELITNQDYIIWGKDFAAKNNLSHSIVGYSAAQRPIHKLEYNKASNKQWLVIIGRQHPPEVTGALALFPFTDTLFANTHLATSFREHFNILIIPNLNPDGVELGYWRHNVNGKDLNRDWKAFSQPEVKSTHQYLQKLVADGEQIAMAVDFHSTNKDIFYTMPNDYGMKQRYLVNNWLNSLDQEYPNFNVIQRPGNNPDRGVFKQYIADTYQVHAITYEMGDNTERSFIDQLANSAATQLMNTMLKDNETLK